jgi:sulfatase modifying factor 1
VRLIETPWGRLSLLFLLGAAGLPLACDRAADEQPQSQPKRVISAASGSRSANTDSSPTAAASTAVPAVDSGADAAPVVQDFSDEPAPVPATSQQALLQFVLAGQPPERSSPGDKDDAFLRRAIGPGTFGSMNQGNPEIAKHEISRKQCLAGLRGMTLQTDEQRKQCKGYELMVPVYEDGDPQSAKVCVDVFEFPNRPCELPFVWASATQARRTCKALGKRLCTQDEWIAACGADPSGSKPSNYAYGAELDLEACNTNRAKRDYQKRPCDPRSVKTTWETCGTHTAPSGAFPRCRSRLGVFDQHGNVAEAMTRYEPKEERNVSQLKGSAFFYVDVHRRLKDKPEKATYPDHCAHNPRWHVQPMTKAWHVNYHLGFRCCLGLD